MTVYIFLYVLALLWFSLMFYIIHKIFGEGKKIENMEDLHGRYARIINPPEDTNVVIVEARINDQDIKLIAFNTTRRKKEAGDMERLSIIDGILHV